MLECVFDLSNKFTKKETSKKNHWYFMSFLSVVYTKACVSFKFTFKFMANTVVSNFFSFLKVNNLSLIKKNHHQTHIIPIEDSMFI